MSNKNKRNELGPSSAGQSGDIQQLSDIPDADWESLEELAEEGKPSKPMASKHRRRKAARCL